MHTPENTPQAVIFDMDGVMVDTEPIYFESNRQLFSRLGFSVSARDYAQFVGLDAARMWAQLKRAHNLPHPAPELVKMEKDGMLAGLRESDLVPMPGLPGLIESLLSGGFRLGLASSSSRDVIALILAKLGMGQTFAVTASGDDVTHGKPAPDIFLLAARTLGAAPESCTVIEDSASGVRAAKAAGMRCIGFRNPHSGAQDLTPADAIISGFTTEGIATILRIAAGG